MRIFLAWCAVRIAGLVIATSVAYSAEIPQQKDHLPGSAKLATTLKKMQTLSSSASTVVLKVMMCSSVSAPSTRSHVTAEWWSVTKVLPFTMPWFAKSAGVVHGLWDASGVWKNGHNGMSSGAFARSASPWCLTRSASGCCGLRRRSTCKDYTISN